MTIDKGQAAAQKTAKFSRERFLAQFPHKTDVSEIRHLLKPTFSPVSYKGVKVFRALQTIIIKVNGEYFSS